MGWTFPWYSSFGSRFNFDYGVSFDATVEDPAYNYRSAAEWEARGMPAPQGELHGTSVFLRDGDRVFHTYSTYDRARPPRGLGGAEGPRGVHWSPRGPGWCWRSIREKLSRRRRGTPRNSG